MSLKKKALGGDTMKRLFSIIIALFAAGALWAECPELSSILPHNYAQLSRMKEETSAEILKSMETPVQNTLKKYGLENDFTTFTVLSQRAGGRLFYRVIAASQNIARLEGYSLEEGVFSATDYEWLRSPTNGMIQILFERDSTGTRILTDAPFGIWHQGNKSTTVEYSDFMLITLPGREEVGLLQVNAEVPVETGLTRDALTKVTLPKRGGKNYGTQIAKYSLLPAKYQGKPFSNGSYDIVISASDFLFVPNNPLKHSLLSAFDKNAATSFKENSKENFISLTLYLGTGKTLAALCSPVKLTQAAVINGDAESTKTYFESNRIEAFTIEAIENPFVAEGKETTTCTLKDYILESQTMYLPFHAGRQCYTFNTTKIIKAKKDECCISEFNIKIDSFGWLFGSLL
jgi:hypothetical protein